MCCHSAFGLGSGQCCFQLESQDLAFPCEKLCISAGAVCCKQESSFRTYVLRKLVTHEEKKKMQRRRSECSEDRSGRRLKLET